MYNNKNMKILLINGVYEKGSTGNIVKTLYTNFRNAGEDAYVLYGRGIANTDTRIIKKTYELESKIHHLLSLFSGNLYGGMFFSTKRITRQIKKLKPDVVNVHCANGYFVNIYKLLEWLAKNNIKTVLTMHAEFMMTGGCGYTIDCNNHITSECRNCNYVKQFNGKFSSNKTHKYYCKFKNAICAFKKENLKVTCVSPWLEKRYKESPIYKDVFVASIINPVDELFFEKALKNPYKFKKNVLYVTPDINDYVKCGHLIKEVAKNRPDIHFTVICAKDVEFHFGLENITYISGGVDKETLRNYYYFADGTLLLSRRETFSMIVAESLACGTPVYGFENGGSESIALMKHCYFCEFGNIEKLCKNLLSITSKKEDIIKDAVNSYSSNKISEVYLKEYKF